MLPGNGPVSCWCGVAGTGRKGSPRIRADDAPDREIVLSQMDIVENLGLMMTMSGGERGGDQIPRPASIENGEMHMELKKR